MNKAKVYFTNLRTTPNSNLLDKMERLVRKAGIADISFEQQFTAIKIHFGEPGNLAYIRPNYAARLVQVLRSLGAKPFLTDCNTLYSGRRANAVDHLQSAMENGFNPISAQCQVIIADGLKGTEYREIEIGGEYCQAPKIGAAIADADIIVTMNHFKGHEQAGFGGALKNLGMGCASVGGKLELHSASQPVIDSQNCKKCGICIKHCAHEAIHFDAQHIAEIDYSRCVGCGQCVALCQYDAAVMGESDTSERLNYKIAEYTQAVLKDKPHFHISFIMNVSPECDCWNHNDAAIIPDLGILASFDPVALDKACADLVIAAPVIGGNKLSEAHPHEHLQGTDKFHLIHPDTNWLAGLQHAEKIGVGTLDYELISVQGGQKDNAITREAEAKLLIDAKELENVKAFAAELQKAWREEYTGTDEGITVLLTDEGAQEARVLHPTSREKVVFYLMNVPFGIQKMSGTISGLVETSSNIGILVTSEDEVTASSSIRSSVEAAGKNLSDKLEYLTEFLGGEYEIKGAYPAWEYRKDSPLRDKMVEVYEQMYGEKPKVVAIHAGLECGLFYKKMEGLDCVSLGPDIIDIHTSEEKLGISSTRRVWNYLIKVLEALKD